MRAQAVNIVPSPPRDSAQAKAEKAGADFEAVLLNLVLGAVEKSFAELPGTKLEQQTQAYSGFAMQSLTSGLARAGGIGIGKFIARALINAEAKERPHESTPVSEVTQEF